MPLDIQHSHTLPTFKHCIKLYLFKQLSYFTLAILPLSDCLHLRFSPVHITNFRISIIIQTCCVAAQPQLSGALQ